jgi:hypothetical protein
MEAKEGEGERSMKARKSAVRLGSRLPRETPHHLVCTCLSSWHPAAWRRDGVRRTHYTGTFLSSCWSLYDINLTGYLDLYIIIGTVTATVGEQSKLLRTTKYYLVSRHAVATIPDSMWGTLQPSCKRWWAWKSVGGSGRLGCIVGMFGYPSYRVAHD